MHDTTKCLIEKIEAKFKTLKAIVGDELNFDYLQQSGYLRAIISATEEVYVTLNDGICESLSMCRECAQRRDMLLNYINILDDFEQTKKLDIEQRQVLVAYPRLLDEVTHRIQKVLQNYR